MTQGNARRKRNPPNASDSTRGQRHPATVGKGIERPCVRGRLHIQQAQHGVVEVVVRERRIGAGAQAGVRQALTAQQGVTSEKLTAAIEKELAAFVSAPPTVEEIARARNLRLTPRWPIPCGRTAKYT